MWCQRWGQSSLLPIGLFSAQYKALLSRRSRRAAAVTQQINFLTLNPLRWSQLGRDEEFFFLFWNEKKKKWTSQTLIWNAAEKKHSILQVRIILFVQGSQKFCYCIYSKVSCLHWNKNICTSITYINFLFDHWLLITPSGHAHLKRDTCCFDKQVPVKDVTSCTSLSVCLSVCIDSLGLLMVVCLQAKSFNLWLVSASSAATVNLQNSLLNIFWVELVPLCT